MKFFKKAAFIFVAAAVLLIYGCDFIANDKPPVESPKPYTRQTLTLEKPDLQSGEIKPCFFDAQPEEEPQRYLEESMAGKLLADSEEGLLNVVMKGYRPYFYAGSEYRTIYDTALEILNTIILNDMTDYQRVHAIYDYLIYYTVYDYQLYAEYLDGTKLSSNHSSFGLKGVFLENIAVCEGFSKAFSLLCGIEGIKTVRISGETPSEQEGVNLPHAWNKVFIGEKWYLVDATFGNLCITNQESEKTEYLSHAFFMVADSDVPHIADTLYSANSDLTLDDVKADEEYDFFEKEYIKGYSPLISYGESEEEEEEEQQPVQKNYVFSDAVSTAHYFTYIKSEDIKAFEIKIEESLLPETVMRGEMTAVFGDYNIYELRENVYFLIV